jgi:hypothetical protein
LLPRRTQGQRHPCGILQVTVDFTDQTDLDLIPDNGLCKPETFWKKDGRSCTCVFD